MFARVVERLRRRRGREPRDGGFVLLESLITISLITVIMSAVGVEFVGAITSSATQRAKQVAAQVADSEVEMIRAMQPADLADAPVWSPVSAAGPIVSPLLAGMSDAAAAFAPAQRTQQPGNITYNVDDYLECDCDPSVPGGNIVYRAVVYVWWTGAHCQPTSCSYLTSTLINDGTDPTFQVNPLAATKQGPQVSTVDTPITAFQLTATGGSGSYSWAATGLPAGLVIDQDGNITGTPTTVTGATPADVVATVTDVGSGATQQVAFTWTVLAKPTLAPLTARSVTEGTAVDVPLSYTCPNGPCTVTLTGSVPGIAPNAGSVSDSGTIHLTGTVQSTAVGDGKASAPYSPALKITDMAGATATSSATWTAYNAIAVLQASTTTAIGATPSVAVPYSCPTATCTISLSGTVPAGIGLSGSVATGTANTTTSLANLPAGTGTVYLTGLVGAAAASGSTTVTISGAATGSATTVWTVVDRPAVSYPGTVTTQRGATPSQPLTVTCAGNGNSTCDITVSGLPAGIGLSTDKNNTAPNGVTSLSSITNGTTVYLNGRVSATAEQQDYPVTVTVTDGTGRNQVSVPSVGVWTVR